MSSQPYSFFESVEKRNAQWKVFGNDPQWKDISTRPENENKVSVSHIDSILMHSTEYSDFQLFKLLACY